MRRKNLWSYTTTAAVFALLCGVAGAHAQASPALDPARYPVWFQMSLASGGGASGSPPLWTAPGWQGIDTAQLPATMTTTDHFRRWWTEFYPRAHPQGYIPDGARLATWRQVRAPDPALPAAAVRRQRINAAPRRRPASRAAASGRKPTTMVKPSRHHTTTCPPVIIPMSCIMHLCPNGHLQYGPGMNLCVQLDGRGARCKPPLYSGLATRPQRLA